MMQKILPFLILLFIASCCEEKTEECPCIEENQGPMYKGENLYDQIYAHIKYPEQAREDSIQGRVTISFDIYEDGTIGNFAIVQDTIGYGLSEAAILAAKSLSELGFCPALQNCNPIIYTFILPVLFILG